jgi:hypothetical protein
MLTVHQDHHDEGRGDNTAFVGRVSVTGAAPGTQQGRPFAACTCHICWVSVRVVRTKHGRYCRGSRSETVVTSF